MLKLRGVKLPANGQAGYRGEPRTSDRQAFLNRCGGLLNGGRCNFRKRKLSLHPQVGAFHTTLVAQVAYRVDTPRSYFCIRRTTRASFVLARATMRT